MMDMFSKYGLNKSLIYSIESLTYEGFFLRMDGQDVIKPSGIGGGKVNYQYGASTWERFKLESVGMGLFAIESAAFSSVYLRTDGYRMNCQYGVGYCEKYKLVLADGGFLIESAHFPNHFLCMDIEGMKGFEKKGAGIVGLSNKINEQTLFRLSPMGM